MRTLFLVLLLLPLETLAGPGSAEDAYQGARKVYYALKADPARRRYRHQWLNVVRRFEGVAAKHPKSARAPDALYTAAELLEELSRISMLDEDLHAAMADYQKLIEEHPRHRLADDSALALGRIYADRLGQPDAARRVLARGLERIPRGDQAPRMKALLASLEAARKPARSPSPHRGALGEALVRAAEADVRTKPEPHPARPAASAPIASAHPAPARDPQPREESAREAPAKEPAPAREAPTREPAPAREPAVEEVAVGMAMPTPGRHLERGAAREERPAPVAGHVHASAPRERLKAARARGGEITLAEQLGLKVRRVVIDAGHGGHDTGAIGPGGTQEKEVALAISKRLAEILTAAGLEVVLTRDDDTFVRLEDRAKMANEARGDLFISVHCNSAANPKLRGIETYTLNISSDRYSIRLAARENSSSAKGISDLQFILADLATKANTEESTRLATRVQKNLFAHLGHKYKDVKDLGNKEALFYVLLGAKMPAILVETSFLSNPEEEKRLASKAYQEDVAQAIAAGVQDFLGNRQRLAKVD